MQLRFSSEAHVGEDATAATEAEEKKDEDRTLLALAFILALDIGWLGRR
jgi:hypothetical protein